MRKILSVKKLLLVLALAVIASMAIGATSVKADEPAPEKAAEAAVDVLEYVPATDSIQVKSGAAQDTYYVYVVKKDAGIKVSAAKTPIEVTKSTPLDIVATFKAKPDKDLYLYCSTAPVEAGKETGKANFTVAANPYSKLAITVDYTALDTESGCGIASIVGTKKADKKTVEIFNKYAEGITAEAHAAAGEAADKWEWSEDGTAWKTADNAMTLTDTTVYIRTKGDSENNVRCSKAFKVKFAKEQKAKTVKVDVKKMTIALKNGYEYAVKPEDEDTPLSWTVILPYNKASKNTTAEMSWGTYIPVDKKATNYSDLTTNVKVKAKSILDIENYENGIYVRVAATLKKPATPASLIEIPKMTGAPVVKIEGVETVKAGDVIAKGTAIEFAMADLVNATGDESASTYEMAIVKKANFDDIKWDTVAWKKVKPNAKKAIKATTKTKYTAGTSKVEAKVSDSGTMILIRRAGVKSGNVLPSKLLVLTVNKYDKDYYFRVNALELDYDGTAPAELEAPSAPAEPEPVEP